MSLGSEQKFFVEDMSRFKIQEENGSVIEITARSRKSKTVKFLAPCQLQQLS